jgi:hypothetical protein
LTFVGVLATPAIAQSGTPSPVAGFSAESLGLPELEVTITETSFEAPASIPAGRYFLSLTNATGEDAAADFFLPPAELTLDEIKAGLAAIPQTAASAHGTPTPDAPGGWFYSYIVTGAGGGDAAPGAVRHAVIDLPPGRWVIWADDFSAAGKTTELDVTGEMPADLPEIPASVTILQNDTETGFVFDGPAVLAAGEQIIEVHNNSSQPHVAIFLKLPKELTAEQVLQIFELPSGATPEPGSGLPSRSELEFSLGAPIQTSGTTQWQIHDFEPGYYALICRIPDPVRGGAPHAAEGMISIVEVD